MLNYIEKGQGQPIIFLHGFPDFSYLWREQIKYFSQNYHVIAPDLPGFNLSSKSLNIEDYKINTLVYDLYQFINFLNLDYDKVVLVGHDWGGILAWSFAMQFPDLLEKLIIINAPHPDIFSKLLVENSNQQEASAYIKLFLQKNAVKFLKKNTFSALKQPFINVGIEKNTFTQVDVEKYEQAWSQKNALECMLNYYQASFCVENNELKFEPGLKIKIITVPTIVIWGVNDSYLVSENLEGLKDIVREVKIIEVDNADHWLIHQTPKKLTRLIEQQL